MKTVHRLDIENIWDSVLNALKESIKTNSFNAWFSNVYPLKLNLQERTFYIGVPNELTRSWIVKNYKSLLLEELARINPCIRNVKFTISRKITRKITNKPQPFLINKSNVPLELNTIDKTTNLNPDMNFDTFIIADYNRFAFTAAKSIENKVGVLYNPFYVYGPTGVGKTHLLQAIGNKIKQNNPEIKIEYTTAETFIEKHINAIKKERITEFRKTYSSFNVLIMDDLQFLQKSASSLVELFHMFNTLINQNAQIILSSDIAPHEMNKIEDRIKTRLNSGVVIDMEKPTPADLTLICKEKADQLNLNLNSDVVNFIVNSCSQSIREVTGALKTIHLHTNQLQNNNNLGEIDIESVKKYIKTHIQKRSDVSYSTVIDVICEYYSVHKKLLETKLRKREIVHSRQVAMYFLRRHFGMSYSCIGEKFGNRDHTTVMHACDKIGRDLETNQNLKRDVQIIGEKINL